MEVVISLIFLVIFSVAVGYYLKSVISDDSLTSFSGFCLSLVGFMVFFVFILYDWDVYRNGLPITEIDRGEYKVGFVYRAGPNVSLGLEMVEGEKSEGMKLRLYQFNLNAFDGEIKSNAKKLLVIETGSFKKLKLE